MKRIFTAAMLLVLAGCPKPAPTEEPAPPPATSSEPDATTPTPDEPPPAGGECKPSGCSGTVCSDREIMTTCEYRPEYACYREATCTRQADGQCGWTMTPELEACVANPPPE